MVNIVCAILKSAGLEHEAFWLLRKTFKSYRSPDDTAHKSYQRYNYNYGMSLFGAGLISNPITLAEDLSNLAEWKAHADQNAFEFLARSYKEGQLLAGGGQLASLLSYRGDVGGAIGLASVVTDEALAREAWLDLCDIAVASVVIYDLVQIYTAGADLLRLCVEKATQLGDEPRLALLHGHRGRLLTYSGRFDEADLELKAAEAIAKRLDLRMARIVARAARGLWLADSGAAPRHAIKNLQAVADELRALGDVPLGDQDRSGRPEA